MRKTVKILLASAFVLALALGLGVSAAPNERERKGAGSKQPARASGTSKPSTGAKQPARAASGAKAPAKPQSARAASSAKGSARAASGAKGPGSARAAAGSKRAAAGSKRAGKTSRARAGIRARTAARAVTRRNASGYSDLAKLGRGAKPVDEPKIDTACPVGQSLKKDYDDNGNEVYLKSPDEKCTDPENAEEKPWAKDLAPLPVSWIKVEEGDTAVVFVCERGFVQRTNPDGKTYCLDTELICPIDTPVRREMQKDKDKEKVAFIDPATEESCLMPALAQLRVLSARDGVVEIQCPINTYSATIEGAGQDHLHCITCPKGFVTQTAGAHVQEACTRKCPDGQGIRLTDDPTDFRNANECQACSYNASYVDEISACKCDPGYFGDGIGEDGCRVCPVGTYCKDGTQSIDVDVEQNEYAPITGLEAPRTCPAGTRSNGMTCECEDAHKRFDPANNTCGEAWCPEGKLLEGYACSDCPAGYYCLAGDATAEPIPCPAGYKCSAAASVPTPCASGEYCDVPGMTTAKPCPAGSYCPASPAFQ